jgi:hypothetical protein
MLKNFLSLIFLFLIFSSYSQVNIMGKPGYMVTPSAAWIDGKSLGISHSYFPKKYSKTILNHSYTSEDGNNLSFYNIRFDLTSYINVNLNIIRSSNADNKIGIGERHLDLRIRVLKEKKYQPSVVIGLTAPGSVAPYLAHDYIVFTKNIKTSVGVFNISGGYGTPFVVLLNKERSGQFDLFYFERKDDQFDNSFLSGGFGGISYFPMDFLGFMLEHDTVNVNSGILIKIKDQIYLQSYLVNASRIAFTIAMNFSLDLSPKALRKYEKSLD